MNVEIIGRRRNPPVNYYVNPELAGGAPSTPGNSNPPTGHTIGFGTINSQPLDNGHGTFNWQCNQEQADGRTFLAYEISTNNPDLQVGDKVKFIYDVENKSDSTSLHDSFSNLITIPVVVALYIPEVFTPNADTKNDLFELKGKK